MSKQSYSKSKGRSSGKRFVQLHHELLNHPNYHQLSHRAVRMLIDLLSQYNGKNNGDFCATKNIMFSKGWNSNDQIMKAIGELTDTGWIVKTKQGYRPKVPNLYAVTFLPIHECKGKLDMNPTQKPLGYWKLGHDPR